MNERFKSFKKKINGNSSFSSETSAQSNDAVVPSARSPKSPSFSSLSNYKTQSISKHYALNNQILAAFDSLYGKLMFRGAYAFGIQFVEVALLEIPKHGYFYSKRHKKERLENSRNALRVTNQLLDILKQLDNAKKSDWDLVRQFHVLAEEQASDKLATFYERDRSQVERELASSSTSVLCADIMEYAEMICPGGGGTTEDTSVPYTHSTSLNSDLSDNAKSPDRFGNDYSESSIVTTDELQRALMLSGAATAGEQGMNPPNHRRKKSSSAIDISSLILCYQEDFEELRHRGRIRVSQAPTFQGRLEGSINGCTVIAPLLCLHHFVEDAGHGLPDATVVEVIDSETCSILPQVRENLGLTKDALIIPSDVHDFLIDRQLLASEQFVTVCGGNILDDEHVSEFVKHLKVNSANRPYQKLAATFFFHEHVIAILKLQRSEKEVWFDLIDSLPSKETLRSSMSYYDDDIPANASRIRCTTEEAFKAAIRWYACSRFSQDNRQYIDMYDWDEAYSDFDPRVFQAFVWSEMK